MLRVASYELRVKDGKTVASFELRVAGSQTRVTSCGVGDTSYGFKSKNESKDFVG